MSDEASLTPITMSEETSFPAGEAAPTVNPTVNPAVNPTVDDQGLARLRGLLDDAVKQRSKHYTSFASFAIRFQADDTDAEGDTSAFQKMLHTLNLPSALEIVVQAGDRMPDITVLTKMHDLFNSMEAGDGRKLIIGHYAGHGELSDDERLMLCSSDPSAPRVSFEGVFRHLWEQRQDQFRETDVILIIDSCYSGAATRSWEDPGRSVEIVAAVGIKQRAFGNHSNQVRRQYQTFSRRLSSEVRYQVRTLHQTSVSLSEVIMKLRGISNPDRRPEYKLKLGRVGVRIPVLDPPSGHSHSAPADEATGPTSSNWRRRQGASSSSDTPIIATNPVVSLSATVIEAVFKVQLRSDDAEGEEAKRLVEWVRSLHPLVGLRMIGVYRTTSTMVLLQAPWFVWSQLDGLEGFSLIGETFSGNLLPQIEAQLDEPKSPARARPTSMPPLALADKSTNWSPRRQSPIKPEKS